MKLVVTEGSALEVFTEWIGLPLRNPNIFGWISPTEKPPKNTGFSTRPGCWFGPKCHHWQSGETHRFSLEPFQPNQGLKWSPAQQQSAWYYVCNPSHRCFWTDSSFHSHGGWCNHETLVAPPFRQHAWSAHVQWAGWACDPQTRVLQDRFGIRLHDYHRHLPWWWRSVALGKCNKYILRDWLPACRPLHPLLGFVGIWHSQIPPSSMGPCLNFWNNKFNKWMVQIHISWGVQKKNWKLT